MPCVRACILAKNVEPSRASAGVDFRRMPSSVARPMHVLAMPCLLRRQLDGKSHSKHDDPSPDRRRSLRDSEGRGREQERYSEPASAKRPPGRTHTTD